MSELYHKLSNYPIDDPPSPPPANSYPHYIIEEYTFDLIWSVISFESKGYWAKDEYRWVKLAEIEEREVWKPESLTYAETQIMSQKPLKPIILLLPEAPSGKYTFENGIHRTLALKNKGSTYVLALIRNVEVRQMPDIPSEAIPFLETFKKKFLDDDAASTLSARVTIENVFSQCRDNDVRFFNLLREGVNILKLEQQAPDGQIKVFALDNEQKKVRVTGTIFGNKVESSGSMEELVKSIEKCVKASLLLNRSQWSWH